MNLELKTPRTPAWVLTWPASLTELNLRGFDFSFTLPCSVTKISTDFTYRRDTTPVFPPLLASLELKMAHNHRPKSMDFLSALPATVETLKLVYPSRVLFEALPRGLTFLQVVHAFDVPRDLSKLPPRLTHLSLEDLVVSQVHKLPKSLTYLETINLLPDDEEEEYSPAEFISALPRCLASFVLFPCYDNIQSLRGPIDFPPALTSWDASLWSFLDEASLLSLPSATLSTLKVYNIGPEVQNFPCWPQLVNLEAVLIPLLPKFVSHLALHSTLLATLSASQYDGHETRYQTPSSIARFSDTLENLDLGGEIGHMLLQGVLPSSISLLSLPSNFSLTDAVLKAVSHCAYLTSLSIPSSPKVSSNAFKLLPRHLKHINAARSEMIYDRHIADLPRSLTDMDFTSAVHLTNECGPFFPPSTTRLGVGLNNRITKDILRLLPLSCTKITIETNVSTLRNAFAKR
jgi:hypothetical protein